MQIEHSAHPLSAASFSEIAIPIIYASQCTEIATQLEERSSLTLFTRLVIWINKMII